MPSQIEHQEIPRFSRWQDAKWSIKYLWCGLFHQRYRKRTGERHILRVSIAYEIKCERCGMEDTVMEWIH